MRVLLLLAFVMASGSLTAQSSKDTIAAHYPGGPGAWARYFNKHFQLPQIYNDGYGSVKLTFHVSVQGAITNVQMVNGDTLLLTTFQDLLMRSGSWVPARVDGNPIASTATFFMHYCLRGE